jgi:hypothetical protein
MEARELRIGNLINNSNQVLAVSENTVACSALTFDGIIGISEADLKPIPLTAYQKF